MGNLLSFGIKFGVIAALLIAGFALLPSSVDYPYQATVTEGILYIYGSMIAIDPLFPMSEFLEIVWWAISTMIITRFVYPTVMFFILLFAKAS